MSDIRKMAEQAWSATGNSAVPAWFDERLPAFAKFAEMVADECAKLIDKPHFKTVVRNDRRAMAAAIRVKFKTSRSNT